MNNLPWEEAAPIPLLRFFPVGGAERVDERSVVKVVPAEEFRFRPVGRDDLRSVATAVNSGWLLCDCKESRCEVDSIGDGNSKELGIVANSPEFRYSLPIGVSRLCTYGEISKWCK